MSLPFLYSILAAFMVGTADFLSRFSASKRSPSYSVFWVMLMGSLMLIGLVDWPVLITLSPIVIWLLIAGGIMNVLALLCLYKALLRGPISIAAPFVSISTIFLTALWFLMDVIPSPDIYIGLLMTVIGACMIGYFQHGQTEYSKKHLVITVLFALGAALFFALRLFILQFFMPEIGAINGFFIVRLSGLCFILATLFVIFIVYQKHSWPRRADFSVSSDIYIPALQGFLETGGIILLTLASIGEYRVIAPAIFSLFSVITILWSYCLLKEKIHAGRIMGIVILCAAIIFIELT